MRRNIALWLVAMVATAVMSFVQFGLWAFVGCSRPDRGDGARRCSRAPERPRLLRSSQLKQPAAGGACTCSANVASARLAVTESGIQCGTSAPAAAPAPQPEAPAPAPPPPPRRKFTLRQGTPIAIFTSSTLSTKANKSGEAFSGVLAKAIVDGDWVIAKQGARVEGLIVESDPGGRVKGVASMTLTLRRLTLSDGRIIDLDTDAFIQDAKSTKGKDAKKVGIGAGVGAAIGAIAGGGSGAAIGAAVGGGTGAAASLATRGDAAEVAGETELKFTVQTPVSITEKK